MQFQAETKNEQLEEMCIQRDKRATKKHFLGIHQYKKQQRTNTKQIKGPNRFSCSRTVGSWGKKEYLRTLHALKIYIFVSPAHATVIAFFIFPISLAPNALVTKLLFSDTFIHFSHRKRMWTKLNEKKNLNQRRSTKFIKYL